MTIDLCKNKKFDFFGNFTVSVFIEVPSCSNIPFRCIFFLDMQKS